MVWKPIETAPKDGTFVLLWGGYWYDRKDWTFAKYQCNTVQRGWFDDGEWLLNDNGITRVLVDPTHWHPLPAPPVTEDAA